MKIDESWYIKPKDKKRISTNNKAGGVIVRIYDGKYLVALVKDGNLRGYVLPKGGVEVDENVKEAAKREVKEETGLNEIEFIKKLGIKERLNFEKEYWGKAHYFLFYTVQKKGTPNLQEGEENYVTKWFDLDKLPEMFWPEQIQHLFEAVNLPHS